MTLSRSVRSLLAALLGLVLVAAACSADNEVVVGDAPASADAIEPSAAFLASVADTIEASTTYRVEMRVAMHMAFGELIDVDVDLLDDDDPAIGRSEVAGTTTRTLLDINGFLAAIAEDLPVVAAAPLPDDVSMELIQDGSTTYVRSPILSDPATDLDLDLAAGEWARVDVDLSEVAASLGELGVQPPEPAVIVDLLRAAGDVREAGRGEVRGVSTTILVADATLGELIEAHGMGIDELDDVFGSDDGELGAEAEAFADDLAAQSAEFEIHVGDDGLLRRLTMTTDMSDLFTSMLDGVEAGGFFSDSTLELVIASKIDVFDYGAEIVIEVPSDAVDITDQLQQDD